MMTKDFDPISEFPFHSEEFGEGTATNLVNALCALPVLPNCFNC